MIEGVSSVRPGTGGSSACAGFTLIETLISLVISAAVITLVLPVASQGARHNAVLVEHQAFLAEQPQAESVFTGMLQETLLAPPSATRPFAAAVEGLPKQLTVQIEGRRLAPCGHLPRRGSARFVIEDLERGGRLVCVLNGRATELLRWQDGSGRFDYSLDGHQWQAIWPSVGRNVPTRRPGMLDRSVGTGTTPQPLLVRLSIRRGNLLLITWIAGAGDPTSFSQPL